MIRVLCIFILGLSSNFSFGQNVCESARSYVQDLNVINKCVDTTWNKSRIVLRSTFRSNSLASHEVLKRSYKVRNLKAKKEVLSILLKPKKIVSFQPVFYDVDNGVENTIPSYHKERVFDFSAVDDLPVFKKCKKIDKEEEFTCFNLEMTNHLTNNFQYPKKALANNIQGNIEVSFYIDVSGNVRNIVTKGGEGTDILKKEVKRIISSLPKFSAAKRRGEDVIVKYSMVVSFTL